MALFKRFFLALTPILVFCVDSAEAKLPPAQLQQARKAYDQAKYGAVLKLLAPTRETDYDSALLTARTEEAFDSLNAVGNYDRSGTLSSNASIKSMYHGYAIFLTRKYEPALAELKNAIKADPKNALAHALLGLCMCYIDQVDQGIAELKKAQQLDAKTSFVEYFARAYVAAGESKKAEPYFNQLVANNPNNARVYIVRGDFFDEAGKVPQSLTDYDQAIRLSPTSQYAHFRKAKILCANQKYKEAIPEAIKGASLEGIEEFAKKSSRLLASAYENTEQYQKAADTLKPVFEECLHASHIAGADKISLLQLAGDYEKLRDYKSAKAALEVVLRVEPKSTEAISMRARMYLGMNDTVNALKDYANLLHADPTNAQWYTERAKVYQKLGKSAEAAADLKKAKQLD